MCICVLHPDPTQIALTLVIVNFALDLGLGAEVEQKPDFIGGCFQVVQQLGLVLRGQRADGFDLDQDRAGDEEIGEVFTNNLAACPEPVEGL